MATSVKMDQRTKDRLERLQAEIKLETGRKVTQQELLKRLVDTAYDSHSDFIDSFRDEWDGLSEAEVEQLLAGTVASGNPVSEEDIDDALYGTELE
ncbi:hypothetical protein HALLA_19635 [Halostagnicola larsenii XH-48]|uniref:Uncharacterized protein n=1 Tax=Halostagnicola larsenii XH-48 TaxID=797299 RepID=W0JTU9_9EURY|nr:hypothetical protein [Halostagnicola larsenii]AHG00670.1 hypothetical protein HALLA_19635 [Halostagnicola larsenii XH-48]